jgi:hypothetical protein
VLARHAWRLVLLVPFDCFSNYYVLDACNFVPTTIQEARTAVIIYNMMLYRELLEAEELEPTMLPGGLVPLCMEQFRRLFSTTRLPGRECDVIKHWNASEAPMHVAVLCNGQLYKLDVVRRGGSLVLPHELEQQLADIKKDALSRTPDEVEVCARFGLLPFPDTVHPVLRAVMCLGVNSCADL